MHIYVWIACLKEVTAAAAPAKLINSLSCCLLETLSSHSKTFFFFFKKAQFATLIQNRYNFKSNGICYWFEDQCKKTNKQTHKEGGWADGGRALACSSAGASGGCRSAAPVEDQLCMGNTAVFTSGLKTTEMPHLPEFLLSPHLPFHRQSQKHGDDVSFRNESTGAGAFLPC